MDKLSLTKYFDGVIAKRLSEVEVVPQKSNQREFNATSAMKVMLGKEKKTYDTRFVYLRDFSFPVTGNGFMTWYDARESNPLRSEYRLFYKRTTISEMNRPGDCLFLCRMKNDRLLAVVTQKGSMMERRMNWLFDTRPANLFETGSLEANDRSFQMIVNCLLRIIGVDIEMENSDLVNVLVNEYGNRIPRFDELCTLARRISGISASDDADNAIYSWMNCQENLMNAVRVYLRNILEDSEDDDPLRNRAVLKELVNGKWYDNALKLHMAELLEKRNLMYGLFDVNFFTTGMILPGWKENGDLSFSAGRLTTIQWDTILLDSVSKPAMRAPYNCLVTFDPGITEEQLKLLKQSNFQLIVPSPVQKLYSNGNTFWFMSLEELLLLLSEKQKGRYGN